jgi:hypothetical protein
MPAARMAMHTHSQLVFHQVGDGDGVWPAVRIEGHFNRPEWTVSTLTGMRI